MPIDDDHQGFLKECQIFNIKSGGVTPGDVTRQLAYDGGNVVNMSPSRDVVTNTSLGTQAVVTSDKGTQSHFPIYLLTGASLDLSTDLIDTLFQNKDSEVNNTIVIKADLTYSQNAYFRVISFSQNIIVTAEIGVVLDDVNAGSRTSLPGQVWDFYQRADKSWFSVNIKPTATDGIIYGADGVLELDGSGASNGYGYLSIVGSGADIGTETPTSFPALNHYLIPFSVNTILVSDTNNFTSVVSNPTPDVPCLAGIKYMGEEPGVIEVTFLSSSRYATSNTNPGSTKYFMSANKNRTGDGSGGFIPINPISVGGGYNSGSDIDFTIYPGYTTSPNSYTFQVPVITGDEIYQAVRSDTSTSAPNNAFVNDRLIIMAKKIGDVGGTTAGVNSLNGLTGNITQTSVGGTIAITSPAAGILNYDVTLPAGDWEHNLTIVSGGALSDVLGAKYFATKSDAGGLVTGFIELTFTPDGSFPEVTVTFDAPISAVFSAESDVYSLGRSAIILGGVGPSGGQIGQGVVTRVYADTLNNKIIATLETVSNGIQFNANIPFIYNIPSSPLPLLKKIKNFLGFKK